MYLARLARSSPQSHSLGIIICASETRGKVSITVHFAKRFFYFVLYGRGNSGELAFLLPNPEVRTLTYRCALQMLYLLLIGCDYYVRLASYLVGSFFG
jgi:hypothetical protein